MKICLGPSRASGAAERYDRLPESHCFNGGALDRIVGTPTNTKPDGAAKDPQVKRQHITQ